MKFNLITRKNNVGQLRLLFSYHCKSRRFFATGVIIPPEDYEPGRLERPVRKTGAKAEHYNKQVSLQYHEIQQIVLTLLREDKLPAANRASDLSK